MDHLHPGLLWLSGHRSTLAGFVVCLFQLNNGTLAVVPEFAVPTLDAAPEGCPLMTCC